MGKSLASPLILILLVLSALLHGVGCSNSSSNKTNQEAPPPPPGTTHGGGGNGIDHKVLEGYIHNPTSLPAYASFVRPRLRHLLGLTTAEALLRSKTWIIAPVTLNPIAKESLGVIFTDSDTQQLGLQYLNEIWLDKNLYDGMTLEAQGQLILHEFVMLLYFLRFEMFSEACGRIFKGLNREVPSDECSPEADPYVPVEAPRPLNEVDYQRIRRVTGLLWEKGATASEEEINQIFRSDGFREVFFFSDALSHSDTSNETAELSAIQIKALISEAISTQSLMPKCRLFTANKDVACELTLERTSTEFSGVRIDLDSFRYRSDSGSGSVDAFFVEGATHSLPKIRDLISGKEFYVTVVSHFNAGKPGNLRFRTLQVFLTRNEDRFQIGALTFLPYATLDEPPCRARPLVPRNDAENAIAFAVSDEFLNIAELFQISDYNCE